MTHNCKKKYAQSLSNYIKITEITEKQQALLLNLICLMFYLNIPSSFFIVTLIQGYCTGSPEIPGSPACPLSPGLPEDPGEPCGPGNPVAPGDP